MKLIFHIGAPKTATTSLQITLKGMMAALNREGVAYEPTRDFQQGPVGRIVRREKGGFFDRFKKPSQQAYVESRAAGMQQFLISDEGCTGFLMYPTVKRSWKRMLPRAFVLSDFFTAYPDYRVVLTVRRQDSFLASCYAHRIEHGRVDCTFEDYWKHEIDINGMDWLTLVEGLVARHGRERVVVLPYEPIRNDFRGYVMTFIEHALAIPRERFDDVSFETRVANKSLSGPAMAVAKVVAERMGEKGANPRDIHHVLLGLKSVLPIGEYGPFRPPMDELRAELTRRYAASNRTIAERYMPVPAGDFLFA